MSLLVEVLQEPARVETLDSTHWGLLLQLARRANLSARLYETLVRSNLVDAVPEVANQVLLGAHIYASYMQMLARNEVRQLDALFSGVDFPVVLLKGAAYLLADLPAAQGRRLSDIDLLVPHEKLADTERLLIDAGWKFDDALTEYDQHYYRHWSHELPPMRHRDCSLELDVHHSLINPTSRIDLAPDKLFDEIMPVEGMAFSTLSREDLVLHSATHLFMSDELRGGLRDLVDMHLLCEHFCAEDRGYWLNLASRAELLGLQRPLYYAAAAMRRILGVTIPEQAWERIARWGASGVVDMVMNRAIDQHLAPEEVNLAWSKYAARLLYLRSHWIRMPPSMLIKHLGYKWWLGAQGRAWSPRLM